MRPSRVITRRRLVVVALIALLGFAFTQWRAAIQRNRSIPTQPFRIAGNLYYVGHTGLTSFLLTGPDGHVLIDGGFPEHAPLIIASIDALGFDIRDVKILLNSHAHSDHAGGLKELQDSSGAALWVSEGDADVMASGGKGDRAVGFARHLWHLGALRFDAPRIDRTFTDGEVVRLGPIELTAHVTPGHTRGCTSWAFPVEVEGESLLAVSICSLTLFPFVSLDPEAYPGINADWQRSFETLRDLPADIFLASHTAWFGLDGKRRRQQEAGGTAAPFVDPDGYNAFIDRAERTYRSEERFSESCPLLPWEVSGLYLGSFSGERLGCHHTFSPRPREYTAIRFPATFVKGHVGGATERTRQHFWRRAEGRNRTARGYR